MTVHNTSFYYIQTSLVDQRYVNQTAAFHYDTGTQPSLVVRLYPTIAFIMNISCALRTSASEEPSTILGQLRFYVRIWRFTSKLEISRHWHPCTWYPITNQSNQKTHIGNYFKQAELHTTKLKTYCHYRLTFEDRKKYSIYRWLWRHSNDNLGHRR